MPENVLTPTVFYILFALRDQELHGYEIIKQVEHDSDRAIKLLTGTLYGAVKRLVTEGLIEESQNRPTAEEDDERRRYYKLTQKGRQALGQELLRYQKTVKVALKNNLLNPLSHV